VKASSNIWPEALAVSLPRLGLREQEAFVDLRDTRVGAGTAVPDETNGLVMKLRQREIESSSRSGFDDLERPFEVKLTGDHACDAHHRLTFADGAADVNQDGWLSSP
jgi:hypothetical protein